jgi:hypothetical protein
LLFGATRYLGDERSIDGENEYESNETPLVGKNIWYASPEAMVSNKKSV